jgi:hypothetical protein
MSAEKPVSYVASATYNPFSVSSMALQANG